MYIVHYYMRRSKAHMHEWLSGGAPPCQGGGRGFESRLVLFVTSYLKTHEWLSGGAPPCQGGGRGFESRLVLFITSYLEMHEWLSGGAPPCQGGGRGFESRLVLERKQRLKERLSLCFYVVFSIAIKPSPVLQYPHKRTCAGRRITQTYIHSVK